MAPIYVRSGVAMLRRQGDREWLYSPIGELGADAGDQTGSDEIVDRPVPAFLFKFAEAAIIVADAENDTPFAALAERPDWERRAREVAPDDIAAAFAYAEGRIVTAETEWRLQSIEEFEKSSLEFRAYRVDPFDGYRFETDDRLLSTESYFELAKRICFEPDAAAE